MGTFCRNDTMFFPYGISAFNHTKSWKLIAVGYTPWFSGPIRLGVSGWWFQPIYNNICYKYLHVYDVISYNIIYIYDYMIIYIHTITVFIHFVISVCMVSIYICRLNMFEPASFVIAGGSSLIPGSAGLSCCFRRESMLVRRGKIYLGPDGSGRRPLGGWFIIPMTDPWCRYINANIGGILMGSMLPYIAAPWIRHGISWPAPIFAPFGMVKFLLPDLESKLYSTYCTYQTIPSPCMSGVTMPRIYGKRQCHA